MHRGVNLYITLGGTDIEKIGGRQILKNRGKCKRRRREAAIAEGKKPVTTRVSEERCKLLQRGLGLRPRNRSDFEHYYSKMEYIY